ncbi:MAG: c-type cytochrome [Campylobacteraceae bacterium]|jgi:cytochrome c553|nr:c-type cytochrome [Campylobacteraceae bacterium]
MRNILIAIGVLLLVGCGEKENTNKLQEINKSVQSAISNVQKETSDAIEKVDEAVKKIEDVKDDIAQKGAQTKQGAQEILQKAANASETVLQKANETLSNISKKADEVINEGANTIEGVKQKADDVIKAASAPLADADKGKKLFVTCIPCHGTKAEKSAVNQSQIINKWSKEQILKALKGYKDGTYGGKFKATMIPTVKKLSDDDMEQLSTYIVNLGK